MEKVTHHIVLYTDGSCLPKHATDSIGITGSGCHGYIYDSSTIGCSDNNRPQKWYITTNGYQHEALVKDKSSCCIPYCYIDAVYFQNNTTTPVSELNAVYLPLKDLADEYLEMDDNFILKDITLFIDSSYVVLTLEKLLTKQIDLSDPSLKNNVLINELNNILELFLAKKVIIYVNKIKGHSGNVGNDTADKLALCGRTLLYRNIYNQADNGYQFILSEAKKYWSKEDNRHPMLKYKQLFFYNNENIHDNFFFSILDYKSDSDPGRKTNDACFGLVKLNDDDNYILDSIKQYQNHLWSIGKTSIISTINLDNLFNRFTTHFYKLFNTNSMLFNTKQNSLTNLDFSPLIYTVDPSGIANRALDKMSKLRYLLDIYKENQEVKHVAMIDITEHIYEQKEKVVKKATKKTPEVTEIIYETKIPNGENYLEIKIKHSLLDNKETIIPFDLGKDTLSRNQFKQLEYAKPKITLVLERQQLIVYYYTIVESEDALGIFCNFYSGRIVLKEK